MTEFNTSLICICQDLIEALRDQYGHERGHEAAMRMIDAMDPAIQAELVTQALTGGVNMGIVCPDPFSNTRQKVKAIKAIRTVTGFGLKQSKLLCDQAEDGLTARIDYRFEFAQIRDLRDGLHGTGYELV